MIKTKLFCFPYAGGSSQVFSKWKQSLNADIELMPVELSGRGVRMHENLYNDLPEVIEDVFGLIKTHIGLGPYALFGHSMGSLIAYELAQRIRQEKMEPPAHIFFSGGKAPHVKRSHEKKFHLMNDDRFKKEIIELGGTPPEFFEHPQLINLFFPILKNDFKIAETEIHDRPVLPFDTDITVFVGKADTMLPEQCDGWKRHTNHLCTIHYFEGGHFFLHDKTEQIIMIINNTLRDACPVYH